MNENASKFLTSAKTFLAKPLPFLKKHEGKITAAVLAVALTAAVGYGQYNGWLYRQPKFHDVTVELGEALPEFQAFMTEYAKADKVRLVTEEVDMSLVGTQSLTFAHDGKEETVNLTIQDTTAPKVEFKDLRLSVRDEVKVEDLVEGVEDLSGYTISGQLPEGPVTYGEMTVRVTVTDEYGNATEGECKISYDWMKEQFNLELGRTLRSSMLLYGGANEAVELDEAQIEAINQSGLGQYSVVSYLGGSVNECTVTVRDTTGPDLELQDVTVYLGETAELEDFLVSTSDISGEVETRLVEELPLEEVGTYAVAVEAEDVNGNITTREAELRVILDTDPPVFHGTTALPVEKNSTPDYYEGVTAVDERDGRVAYYVDTSRVDLTRAGTYYAIYTATDMEGNTATFRRQIVVMHDGEDTAGLAASIAAGLSSDVEAIRDYVRNTIWYSYEWGGDDPIWYGFNEKNGNCYVHALCFQALLRQKGYETQIIWVTDKTYYWNLVKINGQWKHMDSTPDRLHERYSIMNDETRYETLSGRDWDRTAWPVAE